MSSESDRITPEALAEALKAYPEVLEQLAAEIANQMRVDTDTPEGEAAAAYRRDVLKALGAVGVGGAVGYGAAQQAVEPAAADHGGGQVGTDANPVDVKAHSVVTDELSNATQSRDRWTTADVTWNVPSDYNTIQAAIDDIPRDLDHTLLITVDDGTYNEDLTVPQINAGRDGGVDNDGWEHKLRIKGNETTPSNVQINSLRVDGFHGGIFQVRGVQVTGEVPQPPDENASVWVGYSNEFTLHTCELRSNSQIGVVSYSSKVTASGVDFGSGNYSTAYQCKHFGQMHEQDGVTTPSEGSVTGTPYETQSGAGYISFVGDQSTLSSSGANNLAGGSDGIVFDAASQRQISGPRWRPDVEYVSNYSGSDVDDRLDTAISNASGGAVIILEPGVYDKDRTISNEYSFYGGGAQRAGVRLDGAATWTLDANSIELSRMSLRGCTIEVNGNNIAIHNAHNNDGTTINVSGGSFRMSNCRGGTVTYQSGASNGRIGDDCTGVSVTYNGTGNIARGLGTESASAETPTAGNFDTGDIVEFTDTGDGSGTGIYILESDGTTWTQIG